MARGEPRLRPSLFFCFLMLLSALPLLSRRTGLVSHFFRVLVERLGPGELEMEFREDCGCRLATDSVLPPFSPVMEKASGRKNIKRSHASVF